MPSRRSAGSGTQGTVAGGLPWKQSEQKSWDPESLSWRQNCVLQVTVLLGSKGHMSFLCVVHGRRRRLCDTRSYATCLGQPSGALAHGRVLEVQGKHLPRVA